MIFFASGCSYCCTYYEKKNIIAYLVQMKFEISSKNDNKNKLIR